MSEFRRATALLFRRLRLDLRSPVANLLRMLAAGCLLFTIFSVVNSGMTIGAPGLMVYKWIVWIDSLLISMGSVAIFASIIASEREQGTLSLLRMTGMNPVSLILGQGFSGIVIGCLLLAAQFPFVVLTITLGGILWDQVLATYMALLAHLVLCAGIGLFWSVVCARAGSASFYTLLSLFGLWLGTWLVRTMANGLAYRGWITSETEATIDSATIWLDARLVWTELSNIASSFGSIPIVSPQFWWSMAGGIGFLLLGALLLDRRPLETPPYSPIVIRLWRSSGNRAWNQLAVAGKDFRQFMGGAKGIVARLIIYPLVPLALVWALVTFGSARINSNETAATVFWFGAAFLTLEAAAIASRLFRNEITELTWSSLAVLPRWRARLLIEKLGGACLGLIPGMLVCLVAGLASADVQRFFFGPASASQERYLALVLMAQPLLWVAVTSLATLLLPGVPPTVTIFCGVIAIIAQWCLMLLGCTLLWGSRFSFEEFATAYLLVTTSLSLLLLLAASLRLRKLTERN
ncbi:hypothetical protein Pan44_29110 [Caulifigura coniformis]|uniref:ABC-2 family transporter protein n=1 Tax=Caulifigura coniformis TaxID=2527983 RepID=A0A517SFH2_9PLAN|nr:hypothetical protein [Caulifigura coniformis]QDT54872.1 hypothetical protein Pan44_29110 [Caulifigura coniformis]